MSRKPAWRGIVHQDGSIWAWPTLLMDHRKAFAEVPHLANYRARWRQWEPDSPVDFDLSTSAEDIVTVNAWIVRASG